MVAPPGDEHGNQGQIQDSEKGGLNLVPNSDTGGATNEDF